MTEGNSTTVGDGSVTYNDTVTITIGNTLYGGAGDDHIVFSTGDVVYGGAGNDVITVGYGETIDGA